MGGQVKNEGAKKTFSKTIDVNYALKMSLNGVMCL